MKTVDRPRIVEEEKGKKIGAALGCPYFETSSLTDEAGLAKLGELSTSLKSPREILKELVTRKHVSFHRNFTDFSQIFL
jgi:hypothetical protein